MEVEVWYSNWRTFGGLAIPTQWDIHRVGAPYKRMTVQRATFDPDLAPDSFALSEEMRSRYWASLAPLPMHEGVTVQSATMPALGLAVLAPPFGVPGGAVDTGQGWLMLGAGQAGFNYDQGIVLFADLAAAPVTGVLVAEARGGNGGVLRAAEEKLPIYVSASAEPFVRTVLRNGHRTESTVVVVSAPRTLGVGAERVELEPLDLPDAPGSLIVFKPSLGWLFVPEASDPLHTGLARERAASKGWDVLVVGTARTVWGG
jgi:hypothetical protein